MQLYITGKAPRGLLHLVGIAGAICCLGACGRANFQGSAGAGEAVRTGTLARSATGTGTGTDTGGATGTGSSTDTSNGTSSATATETDTATASATGTTTATATATVALTPPECLNAAGTDYQCSAPHPTTCHGQPDLLPTRIWFDPEYPDYIFMEIQNAGDAAGSGEFLNTITNNATGQVSGSSPLYPYKIPSPGHCTCTGGLTLGIIGLSAGGSADVVGNVDWQHSTNDCDFSNNSLRQTFQLK